MKTVGTAIIYPVVLTIMVVISFLACFPMAWQHAGKWMEKRMARTSAA